MEDPAIIKIGILVRLAYSEKVYQLLWGDETAYLMEELTPQLPNGYKNL